LLGRHSITGNVPGTGAGRVWGTLFWS